MGLSITLLIIIFTGIISYQGFVRYDTIDRLKHAPYRELHQKEYFRLLTSGFVHADWMHLIVNMYVFYSFGQVVESVLVHEYGTPKGQVYFILLYMLNIVLANLPTAIRHQHNPGFASIGASGAVSGFVFMFILLAPWEKIYLMFILPLPAILLGIAYLIYSSWAANKGHGRLDHSAHFAGALAGMAMFILLKNDVLEDFWVKLINP